jgi:hypothetical protein
MSCNRQFPYTKIQNFGKDLNPVLKTDPVGWSIYYDPDSFFDIGPTAQWYGPNSINPQLYMAEKCSKNWDGACELASRQRSDGVQKQMCNNARISSPLFARSSPPNMTVGQFLIENSAVRRFCDLSSCAVTEEPFNPLDSDSPMVKSYGCCGNKICMPVCKPPQNPDNDILLNKVLDEPEYHVDLLLNMYRNVKNDRNAYKNTRIGKIFDIFDMYLKIHGNFNNM